jgi:hypothetical protein
METHTEGSSEEQKVTVDDRDTADQAVVIGNGIAEEASAVDEYNYSTQVSIEPNHEAEVYEIKIDGQEVIKELVKEFHLVI